MNSGGCRPDVPFQTNVRANASYTIPWIDVLMGAVFQYRPGAARSANWVINNTQVVWEPASASREGSQFFNAGATPASTTTVKLLDTGDLYGEGMRLWDLKFGKNIRFANKRLNIGVDIFNLFNSDAATNYDSNYDQYLSTAPGWRTIRPQRRSSRRRNGVGSRVSPRLGTPSCR